jgi:hypothetical protein
MKVVLIGVAHQDGRTGPVWDAVRAVMQALGPQDVLVHSGGGRKDEETIGRRVDTIARRAKGAERRRLPKVEVQLPEIGRYPREEALEKNAMQLLHVVRPHEVIYIGEGEDDETRPVLALAEQYPMIKFVPAEDFIAERARRA